MKSTKNLFILTAVVGVVVLYIAYMQWKNNKPVTG